MEKRKENEITLIEEEDKDPLCYSAGDELLLSFFSLSKISRSVNQIFDFLLRSKKHAIEQNTGAYEQVVNSRL